jgi:hypothetical protein
LKKKFTGVKSGDLGGQAIGPPLPIHIPAISVQVIHGGKNVAAYAHKQGTKKKKLSEFSFPMT